jgi:hypothetical protein
LQSGNYDFTVSNYPFGISLTPNSGSLSISSNTTVELPFSQLKDYKVNFDSSGLTASESFNVIIYTGSRYYPVSLTGNTSYPDSIPNFV